MMKESLASMTMPHICCAPKTNLTVVSTLFTFGNFSTSLLSTCLMFCRDFNFLKSFQDFFAVFLSVFLSWLGRCGYRSRNRCGIGQSRKDWWERVPPKVVSLEFVGVNDLVRGGGAMDFLDDGENMEEDEVPTNPTCKDFFPFTSHYPFSFSTSA